MLKKSPSGVLASLRGSTYRSVRLTSSLAAALLDSPFEHPDLLCINGKSKISTVLSVSINFFRSLVTLDSYATQ
jgi:hypothetical protein